MTKLITVQNPIFIFFFLALTTVDPHIVLGAPTFKESSPSKKQTKEECLKIWPSLSMEKDKVIRLTKLGKMEIKNAGEHPTGQSVTRIIDLLGRASTANSMEAQRALGFYVIGYWMTDFMFWPKQKKIAIHALAMLRIFALKELNTGPVTGPFVSSLAQTPPQFDEDAYELPQEWLKEALSYADRWVTCYHLVNQVNPIFVDI